jgi:predicted GNAT superfamily acetyltransferase
MKSRFQKKSRPATIPGGQIRNSVRAAGSAWALPDFIVRHCRGIEEFEACVRLEREVWESADIDVVPIPLFVVASNTGGQVLGAFQGNHLVGFTMAIAGWRNRKPLLHSHMTAVSGAHRNLGIGRQLKLFQRADALARGISLVEWTFDPLVTKNAYFNFMRLGAIARCYVPNAYGITTSPLHAALPTDRLVAEWHLNSQRVLRFLAGKRSTPEFDKKAIRISIPADLEALRTSNPEKAAKIQAEIRAQFTRSLAKNHAATVIAPTPSGVDYILEPWKGSRADSSWSPRKTGAGSTCLP